METAARGYPPGDMRVSDADRDRALSELSQAFQAGRLTADELEERSGQALRARTGKELTALLADLPLERVPAVRATALQRPRCGPSPRIAIAAIAAATAFTAVAAANAANTGPTLAQRQYAESVLARQGLHVSIPPSPGFDWVGTITPAAIAVLLVLLIIFLRVARAHRS